MGVSTMHGRPRGDRRPGLAKHIPPDAAANMPEFCLFVKTLQGGKVMSSCGMSIVAPRNPAEGWVKRWRDVSM
jgi:hypothetical protein